MRTTRITGAVIGSATTALMGIASLMETSSAAPATAVAGKGPYVSFPTPSASAEAVVSTTTSTAALLVNTTGH